MPNKVITIKILTPDDFTRITIEQGVGNTLSISGSYQLSDITNKPIGNLKVITKVLTAPQKQLFLDFITNGIDLISDANKQEQM